MVEEVPINIDAIGFRKVLRYQLPDRFQVDRFIAAVILNITKPRRRQRRVLAHAGLLSSLLLSFKIYQRTPADVEGDPLSKHLRVCCPRNFVRKCCDYFEQAAPRRAMFLRRRRNSADSPVEALVDSIPPEVGEEVRLVSVSKLKALTQKKSKRRTWLIFGLGGLFGIGIAAFFVNQSDVINLEGVMDLNLDSLLDVIPAGIIKDAKELTVR